MRKLLALGMLCLTCLVQAAGVRLGMSRPEVETALGKPVSVMQRGEKLMLVYPMGGRVELVNDRVVDMVSVQVEVAESKATAPAKPAEEAQEDAEEPSAEPLQKQQATAKDPQPLPEAEIKKEAASDHEPRVGLVLRIIVAAFVYIALVMVILKLAFNWADVHADWGQMFIPALSDTIVRSIFDVVGAILLGGTGWFHVDDAVSYFVLLFVLMKTTHACTFVRAVAVAGAAKLMSIVVGGFVVALVLHALA